MKTGLTAFGEYEAIGSLRDRERALRLSDRFMGIPASKAKVEKMKIVASQEGMPYGTVRRLYYACGKSGAAALADRRSGFDGASRCTDGDWIIYNLGNLIIIAIAVGAVAMSLIIDMIGIR